MRKRGEAVRKKSNRSAYMKAYREAHRERLKRQRRSYYEAHREEECAAARVYSRSYYNSNKKSVKARQKAYQNERLQTDLSFKIAHRLRTRIYQAVVGNFKAGSAVRDLGCSIPELKRHLEAQFQPGMSWDNWGEWHIDHIRPLAKFDLTDRKQLLESCHYTNLQPLWAEENVRKGAL